MLAEVASQLDPPTQAALLMTLLGFVLLGISMILATMLGARWVRRLTRHRPESGWQPGFKTAEPIDYDDLEKETVAGNPTLGVISEIQSDDTQSDDTQSDRADRRETKSE